MYCPNCHVHLTKGSKYCPRCGVLFQSDDVEKYTKMFDRDLLEIYFPNNSVGIHFNRISIWYLLFGPFYTLYKKMYKETFISFINLFMFITFYNSSIDMIMNFNGFNFFLIVAILIIPILVFFYYLFNINDILVEKKKIRLNKIIKNNQDKSKEELVKIIEKDAMGNIVGVLITFIILFIIIMWLIFK